METINQITLARGWKAFSNLFFFLPLLLWSIGCSQPAPSEETDQPVEATETQEAQNPYPSLREAALSLTPDQLGLESIPEGINIYGIVMDWNVGNGIATLTSYLSGDASIYLSNGGGWVGGGEHPTVQKAVELFLQQAQNIPTEVEPTEAIPLPETDQVFFYLLTPEGRQLGKTDLPTLEAGNSEWLPLFNAANLVVDAIQQVDEAEK